MLHVNIKVVFQEYISMMIKITIYIHALIIIQIKVILMKIIRMKITFGTYNDRIA